MSTLCETGGRQDAVGSSVNGVQDMAQSNQLRREQSEIIMAVSHAPSRTQKTIQALPRRAPRLDSPSNRGASKMRNAEQAGLPTGWSRNEACEAGSRRRRGAGWTLAPVAAQSDSLSVELDPSEIADHLTALLAVGWTLPLLEQETGVSQEHLRSLHSGTTCDPRSATATAAFGLGYRPGQRLAPALGPWRRTQALTAMGWSLERQAAVLSIEPSFLEDLRSMELINGRLWQAISSLYDRWSMTLGPDTALLEQARSAGVTPPLGWDDDEIDHPSARSLAAVRTRHAIVDEAVIERRCGGDTTVAISAGERAEITRIAIDEQWPAARLALVLDIDEESARRTLRRWRAADREEAAAVELRVETAGQQAPDQVLTDDDRLETLAGPTDDELDELSRESVHPPAWTDLAELSEEMGGVQLSLGLVVDPSGRRWRRSERRSSTAGAGGGDPGPAEQLTLELAGAQACWRRSRTMTG